MEPGDRRSAEMELEEFVEWDAQHRPIRSLLIESMVTLVALGCVAAGIRPLIRSVTADAAQPRLAATISELVAPTVPPPPPLETADAGDPLTRLGQVLRVSMGRYEAVSGMFALGRLSCDQLRGAYVEVNDGWTSYSIQLARHSPRLSSGLAYRDETLYTDVQRIDSDFTASGCSRP
jgi:hypothetical protein